MRLPKAVTAAAAAAALTGAGLLAAAAAATPAAAATRTIAVIVLENHWRNAITGYPSTMPFLNAMWGHTATTATGAAIPTEDFTNYSSTCVEENNAGTACAGSMPNYEAMAAGKMQQRSDSPAAGVDTDPSLFGQLTSAGITWQSWAEGQSGPCSTALTHDDLASDGEYVMKHTPAMLMSDVYTNSAVCSADVLRNLQSPLRSFTFVVPNLCDDMHGLPGGTGTSGMQFTNCANDQTGTTPPNASLDTRTDNWVKAQVRSLTASGATVFVTFDEPYHGTAAGPMYAVMAGPGVTNGTSDATAYDHYSLLAGIEDAYGLTRLASAATATPIAFP